MNTSVTSQEWGSDDLVCGVSAPPVVMTHEVQRPGLARCNSVGASP